MVSLPLAALDWKFRDTAKRTWLPAEVPGCVHSDLRRAKQIPDPFFGTNELDLQWIEERDWEYRARFTVTAGLAAEEVIELVADGLDTVATVTLNGQEVARTENMFVGHRWKIKDQLVVGPNELRISFSSAKRYIDQHRLKHHPREFNDPVGRCSVIRKQQCQFGWDWAPRLVTAGIWRDLRLEAWSGNRIENIQVRQRHSVQGGVQLDLTPELARVEKGLSLRWRLLLTGAVKAEGVGATIDVPAPELWWPSGQGAQPLYELDAEVCRADGSSVGRWRRRIGLRTIRLDQQTDQWGESFRFVVNGRPIFIKGANWVPAHSFVAGLTRADYARDLNSAVQAHLNLVRVWGGGIYESEDFYDLCDELGLLVWQDFMFACTLYPADRAFLASVKAEAAYQVDRLRHRACLALWCGNNELPQLNLPELEAKPALRAGYEKLFHQLLPEVVAAGDGVTGYWPSSEWRGRFVAGHAEGEKRGDTHFWDVWHSRQSAKAYEKWNFRFVSEFGMQSYSSPATNATFCPPGDTNVFGPVMESHQKNPAGNQIVLDYVTRRYRFPKSQDALCYLSQLNQAYCVQTGVEHYRRISPRCMGAIYWQINDCWPVTGPSSLEFNGRWKALHYAARRFFAPALVTAHVPGEEIHQIGNYRQTTVREVHLHTVCDAPIPASGRLRWDLFHMDGRRLLSGKKSIRLRHGHSQRQQTLQLGLPMKEYGRDQIYLRIALDIDEQVVSEQAVFLTPPRFLALLGEKARISIRWLSDTSATLTFRSAVFQHAVAFDFEGLSFGASDNYFDLFPNEAKQITVTFAQPPDRSQVAASLRHHSLVDTY